MRTILALMLMVGPAWADQIIKDANGREIGRTVTNQNGTVIVKDANGRQTGSTVTHQDGTIILKDANGRQVGTVKEKKK